jgi:hypothetical protein
MLKPDHQETAGGAMAVADQVNARKQAMLNLVALNARPKETKAAHAAAGVVLKKVEADWFMPAIHGASTGMSK